MIRTLKSFVNYDVLGLTKSFQGSWFGNAFSKACQYVLVDEKLCKYLKCVFVKIAQPNIQKCITWPKSQERVDKNGMTFE
jgi:hypothetical protein